ncbi:histidine kinase N-terminal 7TM domain-containing diguanylate cyclase [Gracilibacillus salinarum]|uniref:Diguanylate cyclase n=1 Tax=Gracilibacillus salinarum TaxID=2932255 RepID=A0ABY4GHY8_9BACI|nr:histidine kinase N-terminal 7TM domain-containing protein [Gracilibacillus salinarum]UOQ83387.1 diguanylate cyclase [Gracilibacillus salinarum]
MTSSIAAFIALVCLSGVLNLCLSIYAFSKRHLYTNIAYFFIVYTVIITIYCFASAFGFLSMTLEQMKFWTIIQYIGIAFAPPIGLLFIMKYLDRNMNPKTYFTFLLIPFITLIMVVTNDFHHAHYRVLEIDSQLGLPYFYQEIGPWYIVHGIYTFGCMFVAFSLLLLQWKETTKEYMPQLIALLVGQLVPMFTAFFYLVGVTPAGVDPVPMVLWLSSFLYLWAIHSSRLFSLLPIAKNTIFNSINDGVVVLDSLNRLVEYNTAFRKMLPELDKSLFGDHFTEIWSRTFNERFPLDLTGMTDTKEITLKQMDFNSIYQVSTTPLKDEKNKKALVIVFTDITDIKELQLKLEYQAYYDDLTQIWNRRAFFQRAEKELEEARNQGVPYLIILLDVDHFKNVNDTYGHDVGDQALRHVASVCKLSIGEGSQFARYGGEEFVLAFMELSLSEGKKTAEKIRANMEQTPLITSKHVIPLTLSIGVAVTYIQGQESLQELLKQADQALYNAKRQGRNQVQAFAPVAKVFI